MILPATISAHAGEADTLIVSDLHLGLPVSRPQDLLRLLESWRFARLLLLGDMFHDHNRRHWCLGTRRLLGRLRAMSDRREIELVWIAGNHDRHLAPIVRKLLGVEPRESFAWTCGGRAYHALHGDRFDGFVSKHTRLSELLSKLYAFSMRWLSLRGEWPLKLDRMVVGLMDLGEEVAQGALSFATANRVDVIVCGHTHKPHHRIFDVTGPGGSPIEYYNSGTWIERPASFLAVDAGGVTTINHCP